MTIWIIILAILSTPKAAEQYGKNISYHFVRIGTWSQNPFSDEDVKRDMSILQEEVAYLKELVRNQTNDDDGLINDVLEEGNCMLLEMICTSG